MAQPWSQVEQSPQFKQLPPEEQWKARNQYFDDVVAPNVPQDKLESVKQQFIKETNPNMDDRFPVKVDMPKSYGERVKEAGSKYDEEVKKAGILAPLKVANDAAATAVDMGLGLVGDITGAATSVLTQDPKKGEAVKKFFSIEPETKSGELANEYVGAVAKPVTTVLGAPADYLKEHGHPISSQVATAVTDVLPIKTIAKAPKAIGNVVSKAGELAEKAVPEKIKTVAKAAAEQKAANAEKVAREYVGNRTKLDYDSLPTVLKNKVMDMAKDGSLERADPRAIERIARAQSQNVPLTTGQATRDLGQITKEENLRRTEAGEPIRKITAQQDTALHKQLQQVGSEVAPGSKVKSSADVGTPLQNAARRKLQVMKGQASREYRKVEQSGEAEMPVDTAPLHQWLENPLNKANTPQLQSILKEYESKGKVSIRQLEDIRQDLNAERKTPSKGAHYAGEAIKVVDQILDNSGGYLYKNARKAWKAWNDEFTRQAAVRDLVSDKTNVYDRKVALENTLDHVLRGSGEQLTDIKKTLTEGGTEATRKRGEKAWKDVQAGAIAYLREKAAGKREITGTEGQLQFNSAFLDAVADMEKGGKLDILFGKKAADQIRQLAETTRDVRTTPADRISGPNTASRLASIAETFLHIPGVKQVAEHVKAKQEVKKAVNPMENIPKKNTVGDLPPQ